MPDPADTLIFMLKSSIMDRHRQLTLTPEYLEFDDNDAAGSPPIRKYVRSFEAGGSVDLAGVNIAADGILFDEKTDRIPWDFLRTRRYWRYFTVFSDVDQSKYKAFVFVDDWNAEVLYNSLELILKRKFPERKI